MKEEINFYYSELTVVVDDFFPYVLVNENNNTISGYMGELWSIMEQTLRFKGKDLLIDGLVDVILIPIVVTSSDVDEFDYSVPVAKSWYELYSKRNGNGATWASYIETWSPSLWMAFLLTIFILSSALWIISTTRKKYNLKEEKTFVSANVFSLHWKRKREDNKKPLTVVSENESNSLSFCFLSVLGIITMQGFTMTTRSTSLRIIMLVVLFFGLLMLNSYSAVLVSRLAVDKADILFPTLESITDRSKYSLCVRENSYAYRIFKENESDAQVMPSWRSIVNQPPCENVSTVDDIGNALCTDHTVVLESPHVIASLLESRKCIVTRMPGRYAVAYTSLLMRKNLKFKKQINDILQKLLTSGIIDFLQKKWLRRRIPQSISISNNKPVTINHINGILVVYAAAVVISLILLIANKCLRWKKSIHQVQVAFIM